MYPTTYFIALSALIFWFYFKDQEKIAVIMRGIFGVSMIAFLAAVFLSPGLLSTKIFILFRDLVVMGLLAKVFNFFRENTLLFFGLFFFLFISYQFKGKSYMQQSLALDTTVTEVDSAHEGASAARKDYEGSESHEVDPNGELLLELRPGSTAQDLQAIVSSYDLELSESFLPADADQTDLDDYLTVNIPENRMSDLSAIEEALQSHPAVETIELNELFRIEPMEPLKTKPRKRNYSVDDPMVNQQWGLDVLVMDELYQLMKTDNVKAVKKVKLFIIDSGVEATHEDLQARYRSIKKSYDTDTNGHGTHCAGIAAAVTNNGLGIASVFPSNDFVEISGVKVVNAFGLIAQNRLIAGIIEAVDAGADVISVSIGGRSREASQRAFQKVVAYADKANAIIVVAAGNNNQPATDFTPANAEGVITVSAIDTLVGRASFSNIVTDLNMGIAAPGVNIYSTFPGNSYKPLTGTSMACPQVAGLVGLMKSLHPALTTKEAHTILKDTGRATKNTIATGKLIQPAAAIKAVLTLEQ